MNKSVLTKDYETRLYNTIKSEPDTYVQTGKVSGSKIAQPTLTAILTMLGIERKPDNYTLGKFTRGHDVEAKFIERVFHKPKDVDETGEWEDSGNGYESKFTWQYEMEDGYRGCTCSVDVLEEYTYDGDPLNESLYIVHEIKSVGKMKYDRVAGTGFRKGEPEPDFSHCLQASLYALSLEKETGILPRCIIHYVNADDYRVVSFEINPEDYKEELDKRIDAIYTAFAEHRLPAYIPYEAWQKGKYNDFEECERLTEDEVNDYIKTRYPEAYEKFLNARLTDDGGIEYADCSK